MTDKGPRLAKMHYGAGYKLNPKVRRPTPALLLASQIGVLTHESEERADEPDRDALIVACYGTAGREAREAALLPVVKELGAAHPELRTILAFSSEAIARRVKEREGVSISSPDEALSMLSSEGFTRVAIASLHLLPGIDYALLTDVFNRRKSELKKLVLGTPLLYWMDQEEQRDDVADFVTAIKESMPPLGEGDALLLMAHGTPHPSNSYYTVIQTRIDVTDWENVYVYTMMGWPRLEHVVPMLKERRVKNVTLAALMLAAGSHAENDMASAHRALLEAEGFHVTVLPTGLGELSAIRGLCVARAEEAIYHLLEG